MLFFSFVCLFFFLWSGKEGRNAFLYIRSVLGLKIFYKCVYAFNTRNGDALHLQMCLLLTVNFKKDEPN